MIRTNWIDLNVEITTRDFIKYHPISRESLISSRTDIYTEHEDYVKLVII